MNVILKGISTKLTFLALIAGMTALLSSCNPSNSKESRVIKIDVSSSVYPVTQEAANEFSFINNKDPNQTPTKVKIDVSGTSAGFKKFCAGETDINNASRPIHDHEIKDCDHARVRYMELPIAFDAITLVVKSQNQWAKDITLAEIKKIWEPSAEGKITKWNQIRASWPDLPLKLYGSTKDSGTFDYFTEAVVGQEGAIRKDYIAEKDYRILTQKVGNDPNALTFIPYAYYHSNKDILKPLAVDNGSGEVFPSRQTVKWGQYQPFSRPLFIYVNSKATQDKPAVKEFVEFYINKSPELVSIVGYVPLTDETYKLDRVHFTQGKVGTVFDGQSQFNLTLEELLKKEAKF